MFGLADKALAIAGGAGCLALGVMLAAVTISKNSTISGLEKSINEPVVGYADRLTKATSDLSTCRTNRITLTEATNRQNKAVEAAKAEGDRRVSGLERQLANQQRATATAQRRAADILAARPTEDVCASADALILENSR